MIIEESKQLQQLNEMLINVIETGNMTEYENSVYYSKIKHLLFAEINSFCKEKIELRRELQIIRNLVGMTMTEDEIRDYIENLMDKYNSIEENVGLLYHLEATRVDFGVPVIVVIKRGDNINMKKFVFRFKKSSASVGINNLSSAGAFKQLTAVLAGDE